MHRVLIASHTRVSAAQHSGRAKQQHQQHSTAARRAAWTEPAPRYTKGVLAKFAKLVSSASLGAVTDRF